MTFFEPESRDKKLFPWDPFKGVQSHPRIVSVCSETEKDAAGKRRQCRGRGLASIGHGNGRDTQ